MFLFGRMLSFWRWKRPRFSHRQQWKRLRANYIQEMLVTIQFRTFALLVSYVKFKMWNNNWILCFLSYDFETWSLILKEDHRLRVNNTVYWVVTSCTSSSEKTRECRLFLLVSSLAYFSALKMGARYTFKTSSSLQITRRYNPGHHN
jgi:hypothetical protein